MQYFRNKIHLTKTNLRQALLQGHSPHKLALSVTLGMVLGIMPLWGVITLVGVAIGWLFRLHLAILIAVMYLLTPLHVLLIFPFFSLSASLFGVVMPELGQLNLTDVSQELIKATLGAIIIWSAVALPLGYAGYRLVLRLLNRYRPAAVAA